MKKSVFLSALKALYKKEEVDVADHLKTVDGEDIDDNLVLTIFKDFDAAKVTTFKSEATERFNNGVKKGQKETAQRFEKKLKEVFNIDDNTLEGDDLLVHIEENLPAPGEPGKGNVDLTKLTEEELAKIPAYIKKQREFNNQLKAKETEKELAVKAEQDKQSNTLIQSEAATKALSMLDGKNPILPKDAAKALTIKNRLLVDELKGHKFMKADNGDLIPLDAEGKQLVDAQGNPMDFNGLVSTIIDSNFEFAVSDPRSSPANKNQQQQSSEKKVYTGTPPTTKDQYTELLMSEDLDTDQKVALKESYSEQFSG